MSDQNSGGGQSTSPSTSGGTSSGQSHQDKVAAESQRIFEINRNEWNRQQQQSTSGNRS